MSTSSTELISLICMLTVTFTGSTSKKEIFSSLINLIYDIAAKRA